MDSERELVFAVPMQADLQSLPERIIAGMLLIRKYAPGAYIAAEHDELFFGSYETREQMTPEEQQLMDAWGWRESYDSWAHFV